MIKPDDLKVEAWSSKPTDHWGTSLERGVKITHLPTGIIKTCDSLRHQHLNKDSAMQALKEHLNNMSKTFKDYVEGLNKFLEENPEAGDYYAITSADDEGNAFETISYGAALCNYDLESREMTQEDCILNAVCVN